MEFETVEFDEELYLKNIEENDLSGSEKDGKGEEQNANN
jgi:hypothetical protein